MTCSSSCSVYTASSCSLLLFSHRTMTYSSSCSVYTVSSCSLLLFSHRTMTSSSSCSVYTVSWCSLLLFSHMTMTCSSSCSVYTVISCSLLHSCFHRRVHPSYFNSRIALFERPIYLISDMTATKTCYWSHTCAISC